MTGGKPQVKWGSAMTVRPLNPFYPGSARRKRGAVSPSRQVQDWTRGLQGGSGWRRVIDEKRPALPAFSVDGIRWDVLLVTLSLVLLILLGVLFSDLEALHSGGHRIAQLSAGIETLEDTNVLLRNRLSLAMSHPVLQHAAASEETKNNLLIIRSTLPEE